MEVIPEYAKVWSSRQHSSITVVPETSTLDNYLEQNSDNYFEEFLLPDKVLMKCSCILDIVDRHASHSCCFTKA